MKTERSRKVAQDLLDAVNGFDFNPRDFAKELASGHRTLQQSVMRAFWAYIEEMASCYDAGYYDLRNAESVTLAKKLVDAMADEPTKFSFI